MERILVAFDGSEHSLEAVEFAVRNHPDAEVTALYVIDPVGKGGDRSTKASWWNMFQEDRQKEAEEALEEAEKVAAEEGRSISTEIRTGKPSKKITEYARDEGMDGIILGRQGEAGLSRVLLGSVADKVARHSDLPVILVGQTN